ncbi:MAG: hypothetical protein HQL80_01595 [Magnetococcales bacterium]|nr:hypothetical protein [Magnetococcales bacterium]
MFKALLVWVTVIFLRMFGLKVDKKRLASHGKRYARPDTTRIERKIEVISVPSHPSTVMVPNPASGSYRLTHALLRNPQENASWVLFPDYNGKDYVPAATTTASQAAHSRRNSRPPMTASASEVKEVMYSQTKGVKRLPRTVALYGRKGDFVEVMTR